ncbi:hypothetical protein [Nonomuraea zeae]|uniref:Uncharacterized protein n=1 Tax=Nonomuraea zeae TaxID=1642303 RepID=A0A5S4G3Q0_9ACTN|nr:hypothetical protein [Nonomuraea zeae]TMR27637.1 hypothetical protein ETD85_38550 [Nonomuraea zeae]
MTHHPDDPAYGREGINISGGQGFNFGTISGANANIGGTYNYGVSAQQEELRLLIADLQAIVVRHHHQLGDPQGATTAVELLQEEVRGEQRPNRLTSFLTMLTASAGGVTALTEAAAKTKDLIASML